MLNSKNCLAKPTGKNNPTCYYEVSKWTVDVHDEMYFHEDSKNQVHHSSRLSEFTESATAANLPRHHGSVAVKDDFIKVDRGKACFTVD